MKSKNHKERHSCRRNRNCRTNKRKKIIDAVKKSDGDFIEVNDKEIKESLIEICNQGYYIEPTSASTIAGIKKYLKESNPTN